MKIVVVDDEFQIAESMTKFLKLRFPKHETVFFSKPKDALAHLVANPSDLLITDLNMPEMSGFELIKELHNKEVKLNVFVISGFYSEESQKEMDALGNISFFAKPVLLRVVAEKMVEKLHI